MGLSLKRLSEKALALFDEDDPQEPFYDPVHLGAAAVGTLAAVGALYWLFWTLLVYEGGLFLKLGLLLDLASGKLKGPFSPMNDPFEGWLANVVALGVLSLLLGALHRLYRHAARR